jgi:hypothetical protein
MYTHWRFRPKNTARRCLPHMKRKTRFKKSFGSRMESQNRPGRTKTSFQSFVMQSDVRYILNTRMTNCGSYSKSRSVNLKGTNKYGPLSNSRKTTLGKSSAVTKHYLCVSKEVLSLTTALCAKTCELLATLVRRVQGFSPIEIGLSRRSVLTRNGSYQARWIDAMLSAGFAGNRTSTPLPNFFAQGDQCDAIRESPHLWARVSRIVSGR